MIIAGAGGFAIQLYDVICQLKMPLEELVFFDDVTQNRQSLFLGKFPVLCDESSVRRLFLEKDNHFALGLGGPTHRRMVYEKMTKWGGQPINIISPQSLIGSYNVLIGQGVCILPNTVIESTVTIGDGCLINLNVTLTHETVVGDFCELGPGVRISGRCKIGKNVMIGSGAILLPSISIGDNCRIGAGAVVTKNINAGSTVKGVPAR